MNKIADDICVFMPNLWTSLCDKRADNLLFEKDEIQVSWSQSI